MEDEWLETAKSYARLDEVKSFNTYMRLHRVHI